MERKGGILFLALLAAGMVYLAVRPDPPAPLPPIPTPAESSPAAPMLVVGSSAPILPSPSLASPSVAPLTDPPMWNVEGLENPTAGKTMPDGSEVPKLAANAPKQVKFGVLLFEYAGAEQAPRGARPKPEALKLAEALKETATTDFARAALRADAGVENAGWVQRGILEPAPEYILFSLNPGQVGGPVDSPRGYFLFKRLE